MHSLISPPDKNVDISSTHEGSLVSRPSSPFPHKRNHHFDIYYQKSILPVIKFHINWIIRHTLLYLFSLNIYYVSEILPHYLCILFLLLCNSLLQAHLILLHFALLCFTDIAFLQIESTTLHQ